MADGIMMSCKTAVLKGVPTGILFLIFFVCISFLPDTGRCQPASVDSFPSLAQTAKAFTAVAKSAKPAVVNILVKKEAAGKDGSGAEQDFFNDELMQDFFGSSAEKFTGKKKTQRVSYGSGSGVIIGADGYIVTNHHVVKDGVEVRVFLQDRREYQAKIIGSDARSDIALLRIDESGLPTIPLGDSEALEIGEWAIAIGSPHEFIQTVTAGIISAKGRSSVGVSEFEDFIQTDAAINPGNSGGPLLNMYGQVVGINTAFMTQSGGYMGVGFAVPVNMVRLITAQLKEHGEMVRGWLGVSLKDSLPDELLSVEDHGYRVAARVLAVAGDSPAQKAKLKRGDLIVAINKKAITGAAGLRNSVAMTSPGTRLKIQFLRNGVLRDTRVRVGRLE